MLPFTSPTHLTFTRKTVFLNAVLGNGDIAEMLLLQMAKMPIQTETMKYRRATKITNNQLCTPYENLKKNERKNIQTTNAKCYSISSKTI